MKVSSASAMTSSRLDRDIELPPGLEEQEEVTIETAISYCHTALDRSRFFTLLKDSAITPPILQYAFRQYHLYRAQLHQWFGLCIVKAESCLDPDQQSAIMALADHTFTDLCDGHSEMFVEFLYDLGLSDADIAASQPSSATISYRRSFFDDFGYETQNFYEALAGLSGRELCVSVRNHKILKDYFDARNMMPPKWLALHAELEVDHFRDAIRPALKRYIGDAAKLAGLVNAVNRSIDRHVQYFEDLLHEYEYQAE